MFQIVDCSLRDGGYYTDWDFPRAFVEQYLRAVRTLPIDIIEVGYRSPPTKGYKGQFFYMSPEDIQWLRDGLRPDQKLAIMLNAKDCTPAIVSELVEPVKDIVDIVRFACPPSELDKGIELSAAVAEHNVDVAMNVMYMNQYIDDASQLQNLANATDTIQYVALVDSYGSCFPEDVENAFRTITAILPQPVGFHGHDNISLAFANSLAALRGGASMLDATFSGMGRGAGNLTTELACAYRQRTDGSNVDYTNLSNALTEFQSMKAEFNWGTSLPYIVSGMAGLPQAQVMDWISKRRYRPSTIIGALRGQAKMNLDERKFASLSETQSELGLDQKTAVVVGGGQSIERHSTAISGFAADENAIIVHSSLRNVTAFGPETAQIICLPGQELRNANADKIAEIDKLTKVWAVSAPPRLLDTVPEGVRVAQVDLPDGFEEGQLGPISDVAPLELAIAAALEVGCTRICLAGFDGYGTASSSEIELMTQVQKAIDWFQSNHPDLVIESLLPTQYDVPVRSVYMRDLKSKDG